MKIVRSKENKDKNIWGKYCKCGNIVYDYFDEHLYLEENIEKVIVCPKCKSDNIVSKEDARIFYNSLIYECFKDVKGKILELDCGGGLLTEYLSKKKDVELLVAIDRDMSNDEINYIKSLTNDNFYNIDLNDFNESFFNTHFDYVVCKDVLMYLDDIEVIFKKISNISNKIILLNWHNENHKNCFNKTSPIAIVEILKKYYNNIVIEYPSFYKWGYLIKTEEEKYE